MAEPLISFTDDEFQGLMRERGLNNTTRGVVGFAQGKIGPEQLTYEGLKDGTAPILDLLPNYKDAAPENRMLADEEILTLFTNVEDYGKYDPDEPEGSRFRAFTSGMAREAPEAVAGGLGFSGGVKLAMPVANMIPPAGLPGLAAKGVVLLGGGIIGAITAAFAAEEAEKAVIGEQAPTLPSLQGARNWGETTTLGLSMLHAPWTLASKTPTIPKSVQFLDNFKDVASGRFAANLDNAAEFTAKNAGLSEKAFKSAQEAADQLSTRGLIFGQGAGIAIPQSVQKVTGIGFKKFNPSGFLFDPTKGPVGSRAAAAIEKGVQGSLQQARDKYIRFGLVETAAAGGAGVGAAVAQNMNPYDPTTRLVAEIAGSAVVPFPAELLIDSGPKAVGKVITAVKNWKSGNKTGILEESLSREGVERLDAALKASEEYTGPEQLEVLIQGLLNQPRRYDEDGEMILETPTVAAKLYDLPLAKTLENIETSLSKRNRELGVSAAKGKEQLLANAKDAIEILIGTGEPAGVLAAARIQQGIFEESISADMAKAVDTYMGAQKRVRGQSGEEGADILAEGSNAVKIGEDLYNLLNKQIVQSKKYENELWGHTGNVKISGFTAKNGRQINRPNSLNIFDRSTDQNGLKFRSKAGDARFQRALADSKLGQDLEDFRKYFDDGDGANPVTSKKLYEMRSIALSKAADLKKGLNPDSDLSQYMRRLADSLYQDMMGAGDVSAAYNTARAYTYARNNVFTRSFLGELQVVDPDRSLRMDPADMAKSFLRGGNAATAKRAEEINAAVKFGVDHGLDRQIFDSLTTTETMDILIRDSLKKMTKQNADGTFDINDTMLRNWRNQPGTKELFSIFPQLEMDTRNVASAQKLKQAAESDMLQRGEAPDVIAFKNFVETANKPLVAISRAIDDPDNPRGMLQNYVNMINKAPDEIKDPVTGAMYTKEQAREGLRRLILDEAVQYAGGLGLSFSPTKMFNRLNDPIKGTLTRDDFTLMNFMTQNSLIDKRHKIDLDNAIARMRGVEDAYAKGDMEEVLFKEAKPVSLFQARILGATAGQKAQEQFNNVLNRFGLGTRGGGIGGGMIAAEAGSDAVVNFLLRGPEKIRVKQMSNLFNDREVLGEALRDIKDEKDAKEAFNALGTAFSKIARQTGRRLPYAGRFSYEQIQNEPLPEPKQRPAPVEPEVIEESSLQLPTPPAAQPTTALASAAPVQPQPVAPPPVASGPVDRSRFAAMFPEDRDLIQGIGSLMG